MSRVIMFGVAALIEAICSIYFFTNQNSSLGWLLLILAICFVGYAFKAFKLHKNSKIKK